MKHKHVLCGQNTDFLTLKYVIHIETTGLENICKDIHFYIKILILNKLN
jgi:hypothetical protein